MSEEKYYDVCIIGGSMAAINTAFICGLLGVKAALIPQGQIDSPSFLFPALLRKTLTHYCHDKHKPDLRQAIDHCQKILADRLLFYKKSRIEAFSTDIIDDQAVFTSARTIQLQKSGTTIHAKYFMVATGVSTPTPNIPGIEAVPVLNEEALFSLKTLPKKILIYGGQEVAVEMAYILKRLGCDVTLVAPKVLLEDFDPELVSLIKSHMTKDGISFYERTVISEFSTQRKSFDASLNGLDDQDVPHSIKSDCLFVALPKTANVETLNLGQAGVSISPQGIVANQRLQTHNKRIYAAGRCVEGSDFLHNDMIHTKVFIKNTLFKTPAKRKKNLKLRTLDTWVQMSQIGLTEKQAREQCPETPLNIFRSPYDEVDGVVVTRYSKGLMKVVTRPRSFFKKEKILGVGVVGDKAHALIQPWLLGFEKQLPMKIVADMVTPYASLHEVSVKTASRPALKKMLNPLVKKIVRFLMRLS